MAGVETVRPGPSANDRAAVSRRPAGTTIVTSPARVRVPSLSLLGAGRRRAAHGDRRDRLGPESSGAFNGRREAQPVILDRPTRARTVTLASWTRPPESPPCPASSSSTHKPITTCRDPRPVHGHSFRHVGRAAQLRKVQRHVGPAHRVDHLADVCGRYDRCSRLHRDTAVTVTTGKVERAHGYSQKSRKTPM